LGEYFVKKTLLSGVREITECTFSEEAFGLGAEIPGNFFTIVVEGAVLVHAVKVFRTIGVGDDNLIGIERARLEVASESDGKKMIFRNLNDGEEERGNVRVFRFGEKAYEETTPRNPQPKKDLYWKFA